MRKIIEEHPGREYDPEMAAEYRKKREEKKAAEAAEIEKAADMILDIMMEKADPIVQQLITPKETQSQESNAAPEAEVQAQAEPETTAEPVPISAIEIEELTPAQILKTNRNTLKLYNRAIEALHGLQDDEMACRAGIAGKAEELEMSMRHLRIQVFEPAIDWNALAGQD